MSTLVLTPSPATLRQPKGFLRDRFFRPLREFLDGIRLARAMAHRYDVLSQRSDSELAAAGIRREDIPRLVVNAEYDV